jgi:hypothetical protein
MQSVDECTSGSTSENGEIISGHKIQNNRKIKERILNTISASSVIEYFEGVLRRQAAHAPSET